MCGRSTRWRSPRSRRAIRRSPMTRWTWSTCHAFSEAGRPGSGDKMLTQEKLKEVLDYDPETGLFTSRVSRGGRPASARAGCVTTKGYIKLSLCQKRYYAHRLAWLYVYGEWPSKQIDHINCVTDDNRIANLREATSAQNITNSRARRDNK